MAAWIGPPTPGRQGKHALLSVLAAANERSLASLNHGRPHLSGAAEGQHRRKGTNVDVVAPDGRCTDFKKKHWFTHAQLICGRQMRAQSS
jgi:hypothetical protein